MVVKDQTQAPEEMKRRRSEDQRVGRQSHYVSEFETKEEAILALFAHKRTGKKLLYALTFLIMIRRRSMQKDKGRQWG